MIKKQFQFEISLTPVQIIGNERDIRYFFAQYFSEKYYFLEWPFENFSSEPLSQLLELVYKETSFPMNLSTHRMLKLLLVTNLYRIKFGHFMEVEKDSFNDQSLDFLMQVEGIEGVAKNFELEYNISLDEEVVCRLFVSYFQKMFFIDESLFMKCVKKIAMLKNLTIY